MTCVNVQRDGTGNPGLPKRLRINCDPYQPRAMAGIRRANWFCGDSFRSPRVGE